MLWSSARNVRPIGSAGYGGLGLATPEGRDTMPAFDPELTQVMRDALEDVMTKVPVEYSTPATKAYLAECILKAAAQGHTTYNELVTAGADQIQQILSLFT
jgi:hypothetical protein